jgi:hypothetical protein
MQCDRCGDEIEEGEEREYAGRLLCEDCYMDVLSPARACDPWAVYTAKSCAQDPQTDQLNPVQKRILELLAESGGLERSTIVERLQIKPTELDRELAALRHMEKIRGQLRDGRKVVTLW